MRERSRQREYERLPARTTATLIATRPEDNKTPALGMNVEASWCDQAARVALISLVPVHRTYVLAQECFGNTFASFPLVSSTKWFGWHRKSTKDKLFS